MGDAGTMPSGMMTRRAFVGWMLASVAAIVAGSRIWRLFRTAVERGETPIPLTVAYSPGSASILEFRPGDRIAVIRGRLVTNAIGTITAVGHDGITVEWAHA